MPAKHHRRKEHRLDGYDYSRVGFYFVTLCIETRACILGNQMEPEKLSVFGEIAHRVWIDLPKHYGNAVIDEFVVMPNHVHGILEIRPVAKMYALGTMIQGFKSHTAKEINRLRAEPGAPVWQHNYHDRVVRDDGELERIREYIRNNPSRWMDDENNPNRVIAKQ